MALGQMGPQAETAVADLVEACGHFMDHACDALVRLAPELPGVIPALIGALADPRFTMRMNAVLTLGTIGPQTEAVIPALRRVAQGDPNDSVRAKAELILNDSVRAEAEATLEEVDAQDPAPARKSPPPLDPGLKKAIRGYQDRYQIIAKSEVISGDEILDLYTYAEEPLRLKLIFWMGNADDDAWEDMRRELPGMLLARGDSTFDVHQDVAFFNTLAKEKKDKEASRFFSLIQQTYQGFFSPAYEEGASDFGTCTAFGDGLIVRLYGLWDKYRPARPRYRARAAKEKRRVLDALSSDCVCPENAAPVLAEHELFLRKYPGHPATGALKKRMRAIKEGKAGIRFSCSPG